MNLLTKEKFLKRVYEKFGNKFCFEKMNYVDRNTEIIIICPDHGEFVSTPKNFLNRKEGCPKCSMGVMPQNEWIERVKEIHGNKYNYSKVVYKGTHEYVTVICPEHGEFQIVARHHLNGIGCVKCYNEYKRSRGMRLTKNTFIEKAREIHGDKYNYSKVNYVNNHTKVCIICPEHGEWMQRPNDHLNGQGCPKCSGRFMNTDYFIERAKKIHGDKYHYDKTVYINGNKKVLITCPEHGDFTQDYYIHLKGCGCPRCKMSHLENEINIMLKEKNIEYYYENNINGLLKKQMVDFYIPQYNIVIECQGGQHFYGGFSRGDIEKEKRLLKEVLKRDIRKKLICDKNGVMVLYYTNISDLPNDIFENEQYQGIYNEYNFFTNIDVLKKYIENIIRKED